MQVFKAYCDKKSVELSAVRCAAVFSVPATAGATFMQLGTYPNLRDPALLGCCPKIRCIWCVCLITDDCAT